ncbi:MAG TPA: hypothetical protein VJP78_13420, partial [Thermoleophilia bacterium]|nr:hypothetical protein [Thermoleophilia bacterium]
MHLTRTRFDRRLTGIIGAAVVGGVVLLYAGRHLWFFGDEWDFLLHRSLGSVNDLLRPHNEHWSTLPIVVYRVLFSRFSTSSYFPYFLALVSLHVALASVVGILVFRAGAPTLIAALTAFGVVTFGPGGENLLWSFQIGFTASLLLGVVAFFLLDVDRRWADLAASSVLLLALASSGVGVPVLVAITGDLVLRRQFRRTAVVVAGPAAAYGLWLVSFGATASSKALDNPLDTFLLLPSYVRTGLSAAVSGVIGFGTSTGVVAILLLAVLMGAWAFTRGGRIPHVVASSVLAAVSLYVASGVTRVTAFGVDQANASRYVHIGGVLLLLGCGSALFQSKVWARYGLGA